MKKFLVIQTAFLGDAILVTSMLEKLHAFFPDSMVDLVVRKGNETLFNGHPFLNTVHVWDKNKAKTRALFRLIRVLRKNTYDHVINVQRFLSTGLITALVHGKEKIGYNKNPLSFFYTRTVKHVIGDGRHEVDRLNELIAHLTDNERPLPRLYPTERDKSELEQRVGNPLTALGNFVCIAPASVWFTKQWPAEKWIALIAKIPDEQKVLVIGAPADVDLCDLIVRESGRGMVLAGKLSLLGTAALMEKATMNYVNDSAPLHIASAMNSPVTAVFCSTVLEFGFGPLRANGRVVETMEELNCRPCGLHGYKACPEGHFKCALQIEVARVIK